MIIINKFKSFRFSKGNKSRKKYKGLITPSFAKCNVLKTLVLARVIIGWEPQGNAREETSVMDHVLVRDGLEAGGGKERLAKELISYKDLAIILV